MSSIPVAVQIYSVRNEYKNDPHETLKQVASMGYDGVDFFGESPLAAGDLKHVLDDLGLKTAGWHVGYQKFAPEVIEQTIEFHQELGNKYLIVPGLPRDQVTTHTDMVRWADWLNEIATRLAPFDMYTGYHSHQGDHEVRDGHTLWETIFDRASSRVVMQIDLGNSAHGGADVLAELRKYPGLARTVHLKPYSPTLSRQGRDPFAPVIGQDEMPWQEILAVCETTAGTEWYIVEYESDALPALDGVRLCLEGLRTLGR